MQVDVLGLELIAQALHVGERVPQTLFRLAPRRDVERRADDDAVAARHDLAAGLDPDGRPVRAHHSQLRLLVAALRQIDVAERRVERAVIGVQQLS